MTRRYPSCPPLLRPAAALLGALLLASPAGAGALPAQEHPDPEDGARSSARQAPSLERLFYYVDTEDSWRSLREHAGQITVVAPSAYSVDEHGVVWGQVDPRVLDLARDRGLDVMPLILNPGFDQEMLHGLLSDSAARARAVASMVELCRRHGFAGIQFDFENVHLTDRDAYTAFFRQAADALHAAGFRISAAVVHRPDALPGPTRYHAWLFENWRGGYDLAALAEAGDFLSVMTYAQHTRRTPPGPQAGVPWVREVIEHYLDAGVPPDKLSLGIPTGSQHWYTSQEDDLAPERARSYSENVSFGRARALVERNGAELIWSERHRVPYAFYQRGGTWEWVFMEDARSFRAKLDLAAEYGLRGFSAWVLGREDPGIWPALAEVRE